MNNMKCKCLNRKDALFSLPMSIRSDSLLNRLYCNYSLSPLFSSLLFFLFSWLLRHARSCAPLRLATVKSETDEWSRWTARVLVRLKTPLSCRRKTHYGDSLFSIEMARLGSMLNFTFELLTMFDEQDERITQQISKHYRLSLRIDAARLMIKLS